MEWAVDEITALRKDLQDLRESVLVLTTTLSTLDLPSQIKVLNDKVDDTKHRLTIMEQRVAPLWAGIAVIGAAIVSALMNLFIK